MHDAQGNATGRLSGLRALKNVHCLPTGRAFPSMVHRQWRVAAFVPDHSNGWYAMGFHHLSF